MGGNALRTPSRRIPRAEYQNLLAHVEDGLRGQFVDRPGPVVRMAEIPAYRQKADFGDMDVLVVWREGVDPKAAITQLFEPTEIVHNGGVHSFGIDGFQVDLIGVSAEPGRFEAALNYYSWNDLGNLMGRIAHRLGFKYGHQGLLLPVRDRHGHVACEIEASLQTVPILEFLGYDAQPFFAGFDTLEEMFAYAASTKFFDPAIFQLENLNHINRLRNRKRTSYMRFVEWVAATRPEAGRELVVGEIHQEEALYRAFAYFGRNELRAKIDAAQARIARQEAIRAAFGADTVRAVYPGVEGAELGRLIATVKAVFKDQEAFGEWALTASPEAKNVAVQLARQGLLGAHPGPATATL